MPCALGQHQFEAGASSTCTHPFHHAPHVCVHTRTHTHTHIYSHTNTYAHARMRAHTHMHTHTHTHTHAQAGAPARRARAHLWARVGPRQRNLRLRPAQALHLSQGANGQRASHLSRQVAGRQGACKRVRGGECGWGGGAEGKLGSTPHRGRRLAGQQGACARGRGTGGAVWGWLKSPSTARRNQQPFHLISSQFVSWPSSSSLPARFIPRGPKTKQAAPASTSRASPCRLLARGCVSAAADTKMVPLPSSSPPPRGTICSRGRPADKLGVRFAFPLPHTHT